VKCHLPSRFGKCSIDVPPIDLNGSVEKLDCFGRTSILSGLKMLLPKLSRKLKMSLLPLKRNSLNLPHDVVILPPR
jgi:hypothetical protein